MKFPQGFMPIPNHTGYAVSNTGQIYSAKSDKILKQRYDKDGYKRCNIVVDSKRITLRIHQAVAKVYVSGYREGLIPNHIDGNKANNYYKNLEWIDYSGNSLHMIYDTKSTIGTVIAPKSVLLIKDNISETYPSIRMAARAIGSSHSALQYAIKKRVQHKGYTVHMAD